MISTLLVANRGEIACRIFRTCRALGIATVAVYSDADADALHVREADTAVRLPGAAPADTYLRGDLVVRAARTAGADAVHPGYGFLSENAGFARAVQDAGLVWVGPPVKAIEMMASKTRAKELMAAAGVPLLAPVDPARATAGDLPLLLKAAAGGGGRGMRVVRELGALPGEMAAATAEAASAFGDGEVFAEPYVERGRHVEVQIMADAHGTVWALGTRDCSLQRRHQKVIEEAPAPGLDDALRTRLHDAATAAARAVGYRGAGTVEFLVAADGRPYFLEMNTRLQVEHPVTEAVFGLDLVALQLSVAEGEPLPTTPPPRTGTPSRPGSTRRTRPATGSHRPEHCSRWTYRTNPVCASTPDTPAATPSACTTTRCSPRSSPTPPPAPRPYDSSPAPWNAPASTARSPTASCSYGPCATPTSPAPAPTPASTTATWTPSPAPPATTRTGTSRPSPQPPPTPPGTRKPSAHPASAAGATSSQPQTRRYRSEPDGTEHEIAYRTTRNGAIDAPGARILTATPGHVTVETDDGFTHRFRLATHHDRVHVDGATGSYTFTALPRFTDPTERTEPGSLLAPMPGTVVRLADGLAPGATVRAGQPLIWLEAMKMEHRILAPATGTLTALHAAPGLQVEVGALLAVVQDAQEEPTP